MTCFQVGLTWLCRALGCRVLTALMVAAQPHRCSSERTCRLDGMEHRDLMGAPTSACLGQLDLAIAALNLARTVGIVR